MSLDCRSFEDLLEAYLDGTLTGSDALAAREHLRACAECLELAKIAGAPLETTPDLAAGVLERTSGATCDSARQDLCDYVDGRTEALDAELIRMHLSGCEDCAALSVVMAELATDLPLLAEIDPGERFTAEVLARTTPVVARSARWLGQLVRSWDRMIRRPRFALEGAYVMTVLLLVILGVPGALLAEAPSKMVQTAKREIASPVQRTVVELGVTVSERAQQTLDTAGTKVAEEAHATAGGMADYSSRLIEDLKTGVGTFWSRLASRQSNDDQNQSPDQGDGQDGEER
jgi:predicted anti-sigma-YlaC factor YlaD